jgi:glycosyltransferase involved in cell wall biosynthesis
MIIAVSENTKKDILNFFPFLEEKKIRVIYEAADDHFTVIQDEKILAGCRQQYHLPPEFILCVGTLEPRKNLVTLLNAFSNVSQKKDIPLVITGKKGWKYKEIFKTFSNLRLEKKVFFTGYVYQEDLPALYNLATVFVYPSIYEGFGLPPLEAMQCGCPVITSNVSSLPEIVGDAAIKVNPFSVKALEEAIYKLVSNPELRKDYIHTGLKQAEKFSWDKCAQETFQVYQEVLNET